MNIKKLFAVIVLLPFTLAVLGQDAEGDSVNSFQAVYEACIAMRDAVQQGDTAAIRQSADALKDCNTAEFMSLRCKDGAEPSLNGHMVFDEAFADSLAHGIDMSHQADNLARARTLRGQTADGSTLTKTCMVKAGRSAKYSFASKGHQELAVVAEAGGLVTMRVHVSNRAGLDRRYDDTKDVKRGRPHRRVAFDLPTDRRNTVVLEIVNCGKKDCSVVVISN